MKLTLKQDEDARSPQEDSDDGLFLIAGHRQFYVPFPGDDRLNKDKVEVYKKTHHMFAVEAYIHSGVALAFAHEGNFVDRQWDVSNPVGYIFASKEEWRLTKSARKAAESLLETWNQYLSGDVWGYVIEDDEGNHIDSCWGFYGEKYAREEGESALKYAEKHALTEANQI